MKILSLIFQFSHSIEVSERILSCMAAARIIPVLVIRYNSVVRIEDTAYSKAL